MTGTDVKKPNENSKSKKTAASSTDTTAEATKKQPAQAGVIASTDIGAADGKADTGSGAGLSKIESTILGAKTGGRPAASPKGKEPQKSEQSQQPIPKPSPVVRRQSSGFWPLALGGVCAAAIGALATFFVLPLLPESWLPPRTAQIDDAAIRASAVRASEEATLKQIEAFRQELASRPAPESMDPAIVAQLQTRIDEQAGQIQQLASRPVVTPEIAARMQQLAAQAEALEAQIQSAAQQAQSQLSVVQSEAAKLQEAAEGSTRRAEAVAAIASLQTALDRGVTPQQASQALAPAGIQTPAAFDREIPSLDALQTSFPEAARAALRVTLREDSNERRGNFFGNFLRAQTGARSIEPREGTDPDAILSRANAEVAAGRIGAAIKEISSLPDTAKAAPTMAAWLDQAGAYRDAQAALSDLSVNSN